MYHCVMAGLNSESDGPFIQSTNLSQEKDSVRQSVSKLFVKFNATLWFINIWFIYPKYPQVRF